MWNFAFEASLGRIKHWIFCGLDSYIYFSVDIFISKSQYLQKVKQIHASYQKLSVLLLPNKRFHSLKYFSEMIGFNSDQTSGTYSNLEAMITACPLTWNLHFSSMRSNANIALQLYKTHTHHYDSFVQVTRTLPLGQKLVDGNRFCDHFLVIWDEL